MRKDSLFGTVILEVQLETEVKRIVFEVRNGEVKIALNAYSSVLF